MKIKLSHGKAGIELELPENRDVTVLRARPAPAIEDVHSAVSEALAHPIESPPLERIARGRRDAVIVISDITRPTPNRLILPPILETIERAGVARDKITILIATGIHRPNEGDELIELVGEPIASRYRCINHLGQAEASCRTIGQTRSGIPVNINRHYLDAGLKILTGLIEPHFWAGFSGGGKAILPGISGIATMRRMHGVAMIDACMANCGLIEGNVFHEAGLEVARMAGVDFIVNVTVDENKKTTGVFAGDVEAAHHEGAKSCARCTGFEIDRPADLVIASGGGYPLDLTFYQAAKAMAVAWMLLREGGQSLIVAECAEGIGSPHFSRLIEQSDSPEHLLRRLAAKGFFRVDQWNGQVMARIALENKVALHARSLPRELLRKLDIESVPDPDAWLADRLDSLGPHAKIIVIPDGPYIYGRVSARAV